MKKIFALALALMMIAACLSLQAFADGTELPVVLFPDNVIPDVVWGDANGDEQVKNNDIVRLKNYLANYDDETGISSNGTTTYELNLPAADANGDGAIKNNDIVRLKNYLANYDDETGVSSNGTTTYILGPADPTTYDYTWYQSN